MENQPFVDYFPRLSPCLWEFQDPKMEVLYHISGHIFGGYSLSKYHQIFEQWLTVVTPVTHKIDGTWPRIALGQVIIVPVVVAFWRPYKPPMGISNENIYIICIYIYIHNV